MTCSSCVALIENKLKDHTGVKDAVVGLLSEQGEVIFEDKKITPSAIVSLIEVFELNYV